MFVQIIEGRVADAEGLRRQMDRWATELRSGASGYVGTTAGVADDGRGIAVARFESAEAAKTNSQRPEQGEWWTATEGCFDGDVTFTDSEEIDEFLGGGSDDATFVQVMKGTADRSKLREMDEQFEKVAGDFRPDLIGGTRIWTAADTYVDVAYFTSEADAREGEKNEPPPELAAGAADYEQLMADVEYLDLRDPWLY